MVSEHSPSAAVASSRYLVVYLTLRVLFQRNQTGDNLTYSELNLCVEQYLGHIDA